MQSVSSRVHQLTSMFSLGPNKNRVGAFSSNFHLRLCGPLEVTKAIGRYYEAIVTKNKATSEIVSMGMMQSFTAGWSRLTITPRNAFILTFYTDDEDSFMAICDFREAILNSIPSNVSIPMLVVGYHRDSHRRSMVLSETVKRLVVEVWGQTYRQACAGSEDDLHVVVQDIVNTVK